MANKSIKELRNLSTEELMSKIRDTQSELFQARMQQVTGQLENVNIVWSKRKSIARMKTLLSAKSKENN